MKTTKKILALLLSAVMMVTFMPAMAFAGETSGEEFPGIWDEFEPDNGVYMIETAGTENGSLEIDGTDTQYKTDGSGGEKRTFTASVSGAGGNSSSVQFISDEGYHLNTVQIRHENVSIDEDQDGRVVSECTYDYHSDDKELVNQENESDVIAVGDDCIYNISALPEYHKLWIGASFASDEEEDVIYETKLWIGEKDNTTSINILPGDEFALNATLLRNGNPVTEDVEFELITDGKENQAFDSDEEIVEYGTGSLSEGVYSWDCSAIPVFDGDVLLNGFANVGVKAIYESEEYFCDWDAEISVGCRLNYNETIKSEGLDRILTVNFVDIANEDDVAVAVDPSYGDDEDPFAYGITVKDANGESVDVSGKVAGNVLTLTKAEVREIIENTDPGFTVFVDAIGKSPIGTVNNPIFCHDEISVLIDTPNIYSDCYIDFPSSIEYVPGQTVYDKVGEFQLKYKDTEKGTEPIAEADNLYEFRFVNVDPSLLDTPEKSEAASVLIKEGEDKGKLKLDHLGKYWIVAAGLGDYRGFVIDSFVLTDADIYYERAPKANYDQEYQDGDPITLITEGTLNKPDEATIQYKLDNGTWGETVPAVTDPGTYKVSYRTIDQSGNVIIAEESDNVYVFKKRVDLSLKSITKTYGTADILTFDELVENAENYSDEIKDHTYFSRERGENVNEEGYRIYAICDSENYDVIISDGCLNIEKADYNLSIMENISFDVVEDGGSCEMPYFTDADADKVHVESLENPSKLTKLEAEDGVLTIEADESCSERIKLIVDGDDNHNGCEKEIDIEATAPLAVADDGSSVSLKSDNSAEFEGVYTLSVTKQTSSSGEEGREESSFDITLQKDGEAVDFGGIEGASLIVKVKMDSSDEDIEKLIGGTKPNAECEGKDQNSWFEYVQTNSGTDTYFCFSTPHLSTWTLSAVPAVELNSENGFWLNVPETIKEIGQNINFGKDAVRFGDGENDYVDPSCYQLRYVKAGTEAEIDYVCEPGVYTVKVYAIEGMGYKDSENILSTEFEILGSHDHSFNKWNYNQDLHWKECDEDGCHEIDAESREGHNFKKVVDNKYLASEATCTEYAKYYCSCECGAMGTETFIDEKGKLKDHDLKFVEAVSATKTEPGCKEHWECKYCGKFFIDEKASEECLIDDIYIKPIGHDHVWAQKVATKATFDNDGVIEVYCSVTGCEEKESSIIIPKVSAPSLSATAFTYNGKTLLPSVRIPELRNGVDYTVAYPTASKSVGTYAVTVTLMGEKYSGTRTLKYVINPKGATIKKPTRGKKYIRVRWKKQYKKMSKSRITGYQVRYATKSDFSDAKYKSAKGYKRSVKTISKLKRKTRYYVQVRTYKKVSGKTYYSTWSKTKSIKTK